MPSPLSEKSRFANTYLTTPIAHEAYAKLWMTLVKARCVCCSRLSAFARVSGAILSQSALLRGPHTELTLLHNLVPAV